MAWPRSAAWKATLTLLLPAATRALPSTTDGSSNRERRGERRGDEKTLEERRRRRWLWTKKTNP